MSLRLKIALSSLVLILLGGVLGFITANAEASVTSASTEALGVNVIVTHVLKIDRATDGLESGPTLPKVAAWEQAVQAVNDKLDAEAFDQQNEINQSAKIKVDLANATTTVTSVASDLSAKVIQASAGNRSLAVLSGQVRTLLTDSFGLVDIEGQNLVTDQTATRSLVLGLSGLLIVAIITSGVFLYITITLPIRSLKTVIENISRGKLDSSISARVLAKNDEIGALARAFDRTIVSLKLAMREEGKTESPTPPPASDHSAA